MQPRTVTKRRKIVLVAEDNPTIAWAIGLALRKAGFSPKLVHDGIDALNMIMEMKPDALVLDLELPRLQGAEICSLVRKSHLLWDTPIVVISGHAEVGDRLQAFDLGADDFVTKPFSVEEMIARVRAVLTRSGLGSSSAFFYQS